MMVEIKACFTYVDDIVSAAIKISNSNKTNGKAYNQFYEINHIQLRKQ